MSEKYGISPIVGLINEINDENRERAKEMQLNIKKKPEHSTVEPMYIRAIYGKLRSNEDVGNLIGLSGSAVSEALRENKTRSVNELAARCIWQERYATPEKDAYRVALIKAPPHIIETMRDLVAASGGSVSVLDK